MGQKVHPYGFRLGFTKTWRSRWFATHDYKKLLQEDLDLKESLRSRLKAAGVSSVEVDRPGNKLRVTIRTSRPGIIIGRKGAEIEKMTEEISKMAQGKQIKIDIQEIKTPELDAQLVAENVALQIERRIAYRRAMKKAVQTAMDFGAGPGFTVVVSDGVVDFGQTSAFANSPDVLYRSCGSFDIALPIASSISSGTVGSTLRSDGTGSVKRLVNTA